MDIFIPIFICFAIFVLCSLCGFCCRKQNEGAIFSSKKINRQWITAKNHYFVLLITKYAFSIFSSRCHNITNTPTCRITTSISSRWWAGSRSFKLSNIRCDAANNADALYWQRCTISSPLSTNGWKCGALPSSTVRTTTNVPTCKHWRCSLSTTKCAVPTASNDATSGIQRRCWQPNLPKTITIQSQLLRLTMWP